MAEKLAKKTLRNESTGDSMSERVIQSQILRELGGRPDIRLFRNTVGVGWVGRGKVIGPGEVHLWHAQRVTMGLATGSGDLIGWRRFQIQRYHVGMEFAQFFSVEVKTDKGPVGDNQENWMNRVNAFGGRAIIVRSLEDAISQVPR